MADNQVNFPETHLEHFIKRALEHHRLVLDPSDARKIVSRIEKGRYFVIARNRKHCGSMCAVKRDGCIPTCVMVNHTNRNGIVVPLPIVYCEVKRELITVLPKGCIEFREHKKFGGKKRLSKR